VTQVRALLTLTDVPLSFLTMGGCLVPVPAASSQLMSKMQIWFKVSAVCISKAIQGKLSQDKRRRVSILTLFANTCDWQDNTCIPWRKLFSFNQAFQQNEVIFCSTTRCHPYAASWTAEWPFT